MSISCLVFIFFLLSNCSSLGWLLPGVPIVLFPAVFAAVAEMGFLCLPEANVFKSTHFFIFCASRLRSATSALSLNEAVVIWV